ncbi:MAG: hypothetical protein J3K34DRAFT_84051 [Monoraphidium minutum]|nr:MAG: hypothetical protein J3K34DRAFT_84051 [Monoraphidium minutum]
MEDLSCDQMMALYNKKMAAALAKHERAAAGTAAPAPVSAAELRGSERFDQYMSNAAAARERLQAHSRRLVKAAANDVAVLKAVAAAAKKEPVRSMRAKLQKANCRAERESEARFKVVRKLNLSREVHAADLKAAAKREAKLRRQLEAALKQCEALQRADGDVTITIGGGGGGGGCGGGGGDGGGGGAASSSASVGGPSTPKAPSGAPRCGAICGGQQGAGKAGAARAAVQLPDAPRRRWVFGKSPGATAASAARPPWQRPASRRVAGR